MLDDIYHACADFMAAFETNQDIDEGVERLRAALPTDGIAGGIVSDLIVEWEKVDYVDCDSECDIADAFDRAKAWLKENVA